MNFSPGAHTSRFSARVATLQRIDRWLGPILCGLLTAIRRCSDFFRPKAARPRTTRNILFIKLVEQGSTVLAHAALSAAAARVGRDRVFFLVFEENRFVVDLLGLIPERNVLTIRTRSAWTMAASAAARLSEIRRLSIDACVDLEFFSRASTALSYLTGASQRVGFHSYFGEGPYRGDLLTHRVLYNPHLHTSQTFASLVRALEIEPGLLPTFAVVPSAPAAPTPFQPKPEEVLAARGLLGECGLPPAGRLILLNANAGDLLPQRRWENGNYVGLARKLLEEFPELWVGFTGSPEEETAVSQLARQVASPRCLCLAGRTSLRQLLAIYGLAEILVTNDSGPAHFAALTGIDVAALFGPETPLLFAAPGPRTHAIWAGLACSPCVNAFNQRQTACRDNACMKAITVDQVFLLVARIYRSRTHPEYSPPSNEKP